MNSFPPTRHSVLLAAKAGNTQVRERAFDTLVAIYWKPVYKYIRIRWSAPNEDAQDLTQEFFTSALEKNFFDSYDSGKSRFRTYLRTCVDGVVANARKAAGRIKRGGHVRVLSLDFDIAESELRHLITPSAMDPDELFELESQRSLFALAVDDLREECASCGKVTHFALFERYDLEPPADNRRPTYSQLASEFGIPTTQVTNFLAFARARFRHHVLHRLEMAGTE